MSDPVLTTGQYSIGLDGSSSAYVYGGRSSGFTGWANGVQVATTTWDTGSMATQDQAVVGHDGQVFGIDTQPGMAVTQTGQCVGSTPQAAMDAYDALAGVWDIPSVRLADSQVVVLRAFYPGSAVVRRAYGRARKIVPGTGTAYARYVPFTASFQAADSTWYSDALSYCTLTMATNFSGGLLFPATPPFIFGSTTRNNLGSAANSGSLPTWPVFTFQGPIAFPQISYVNTPVILKYQGILGSGDRLVIDTRPWARTILLNGSGLAAAGIRVAGLLTGDPMIGTQLQPGTTQVLLTGQDYTGRAYCQITWRNAHKFIGGSS